MIGQQLDLKLQVFNSDDDWKNDKVILFVIDNLADHLDLKDVSEQLCEKGGDEYCEIFIKITNSLDMEIDITLTLMLEHSIIELKDGVWQSFPVNKISTSSHFYFFPRHQNQSVDLAYKSTYNDLRIVYTLWKAEDKSIDPTEWPFPKSVQNFDD